MDSKLLILKLILKLADSNLIFEIKKGAPLKKPYYVPENHTSALLHEV